ncbi:hypothetical protein MS2017_0535 [Bathymodiolus thermophilus thioautotrophic gill symbiont]|uniref:Cadherin domain-containing protein n=2 Tax=Bathymodiolus thermophilus thioautotrophic gill symbiont TaxID=2360 RepID=A0A3G3IL19_9GAMM|nr:JDVT-CTERM domain-containing protein [Bathymodiolus thermophilus thioautotrophic gill symbiont]AYQ56274.1 hypothetical protein MS2017_0535 [Bathymodiolus thermophilus thioautotrophic gill symbiont]
MNIFNRFIIAALLVLFASQVFATLNPNPATKEFHVSLINNTFEIITAYSRSDEVIAISGNNRIIRATCVLSSPAEQSSEFTHAQNHCTDTISSFIPSILAAGDEVNVMFRSGENFEGYTLCVDGNCIAGLTITSTNTFPANEKAASTTHTLTANDPAATFSITENTSGFFSLSGTNNATLTFNGTTTNYESTTKSYTVKIKATTGDGNDKNTIQTITVTLNDLNDETPTAITLTGNRTIVENTAAGTELGTLSATDADTNNAFTYASSNTTNFEITTGTDKLKLKSSPNYEALPADNKTLSTSITVTDGNGHSFNKIFNFTVSDIDDTAPTNIVLSKSTITSNALADTIIGTLSATDTDTTSNLIYNIIGTNDNFEIIGNKLKLKTAASNITFPITITITASDGTLTSAQQNFTITKTTINLNIAPVINQFIVTQGEKEGRIISQYGGEVKIHALVDTQTYEWSSTDININNGASATLTFDPGTITTFGTITIKLKATTGEHTSERTLLLKLIEKSKDVKGDSDGDGIPDEKDINNAGNKIQAGEGENKGKAITSKGNTRILLGTLALGKNSTFLTLDQMKEYVTTSNLPDKTKDTLTTGAIYDYVVEGLSTTGTSEVIIELTTAIPKDAELRKYSLVNGWSAFVNNNDNTIKSKISTTCTDDNWQTGLITGATCLKLTIKDGGENDTDGQQTDNTGDVNGVVASTISIAKPIVNDGSSSNNSSGSGGGCVYNPNASARFDIGFILLMTLSVYYLIRRRRRFSY